MIYCNTNYVTVNFVANAILASGDAPAMTEYPGDAKILATFGDATYINLGTITTDRIDSIVEAAQTAKNTGKPWVLDPVAVGLGLSHDSVAKKLKEFKPAVVRGNASEIIALANIWELGVESKSTGPSGVESTDGVDAAQESAKAIAKWTNGAVAVSGEVDLITDGERVLSLSGGSEMMTKITGAGCSLGGVVAVYAAKFAPFEAAAFASTLYNIASERAEKSSNGSGSFQVNFLDELTRVKKSELFERSGVQV